MIKAETTPRLIKVHTKEMEHKLSMREGKPFASPTGTVIEDSREDYEFRGVDELQAFIRKVHQRNEKKIKVKQSTTTEEAINQGNQSVNLKLIYNT